MINSVYVVQHSYELDGCDETKFIGVFSSYDTARKIVENYKELSGFKEYQNNFYIDEYGLDIAEWRDGFITLKPKKK